MTKPIPLKDPMTCPACFSMDLYCDHHNEHHVFNEFPHQFESQTLTGAIRKACKEGWAVHWNKRTATCPKCVKELRN